MRRVNLSQATFEYDPEDPERFRAGLASFGKQVGARDSGASLYEVPPGQSICPYHYEYGEEEWLLVLEGRPTLRTPDGEQALDPQELAFFPKGPDGAHEVRNDTGATVRVLMWSTVVEPTVTAYPDSDKVGIWTGVEGENVMVHRSAHVGYYDGEATG
jgi:uncharacterized cupin superfamily protein